MNGGFVYVPQHISCTIKNFTRLTNVCQMNGSMLSCADPEIIFFGGEGKLKYNSILFARGGGSPSHIFGYSVM